MQVQSTSAEAPNSKAGNHFWTPLVSVQRRLGITAPGYWVVATADRMFTVAILAQGTSWAVAVTQAFLGPGFNSGQARIAKHQPPEAVGGAQQLRSELVGPCRADTWMIAIARWEMSLDFER